MGIRCGWCYPAAIASRQSIVNAEEFGREIVERTDVLEREQSCDGFEDVDRVVLGKTDCLAVQRKTQCLVST